MPSVLPWSRGARKCTYCARTPRQNTGWNVQNGELRSVSGAAAEAPRSTTPSQSTNSSSFGRCTRHAAWVAGSGRHDALWKPWQPCAVWLRHHGQPLPSMVPEPVTVTLVEK